MIGSRAKPIPLISVVIPSYNSAHYLAETLNSILTQTLSDIEVIVVDDGSSDNTEDIISSLKSPKIKYAKQVNSGGPSRPRNVGVDMANGKYIGLFDSDDIMMPGKLAEAVAFLECQPKLGLIFTNFVVCDGKGKQFPGTYLDPYEGFWQLPKRKVGEQWFVIESCIAYEGLFFENYVGTSGVVIPKNVFTLVGKFDENLSVAEDWDMWLRISRGHDIGYIDMIGHRYRQRETGIMMSRDAKSIAIQRIQFMRKQLESGLGPATSKQAQRFIARVQFGLGYCYQCDGDLKQARQNYWLSLKEQFSWKAVRGVFISYLGSRIVLFLRDWKSKMANKPWQALRSEETRQSLSLKNQRRHGKAFSKGKSVQH